MSLLFFDCGLDRNGIGSLWPPPAKVSVLGQTRGIMQITHFVVCDLLYCKSEFPCKLRRSPSSNLSVREKRWSWLDGFGERSIFHKNVGRLKLT